MRVGIVDSIGATTTYHRVEHGDVDCWHAQRGDCTFRIVDRAAVPAEATPCTICFGEPDIYTGGNSGWATTLRNAEDPEAVIRS